MKRTALFFCFLCGMLAAQEISFQNTNIAGLRALAAKENKLIFIDAYTSWCGPCKAMAKHIFTDSAVAGFFNANFINAKMDMEKGEGLSVSRQYSVGCYPSFLFLDSTGKAVHRGAGYLEKQEFIALAEKALSPGENFGKLQSDYANGNRDPGFILRFFKESSQMCLPAGDMASDYLREMGKEELARTQNWEIFQMFVTAPESAAFRRVKSDRAYFADRLGAAVVDEKLFQVYHEAAMGLIYGQERINEPGLKSLRAEIGNLDFTRKEELQWMIDLSFYDAAREWDRYFSTGQKLFEKHRRDDPTLLNNVSYNIYEHSYNKVQLRQAEEWARRSIAIEEASYNLDTYAALLSRNGKKKQAIEVQKKAIALAQAHGEDASQYEEMLKKIEQSPD